MIRYNYVTKDQGWMRLCSKRSKLYNEKWNQGQIKFVPGQQRISILKNH